LFPGGNLSGLYSCRITGTHRLVYEVEGSKIFVSSCYKHYKK
jgi:Txe/YoeB family toxin of Txe-Axe toxin-antitoxin module